MRIYYACTRNIFIFFYNLLHDNSYSSKEKCNRGNNIHLFDEFPVVFTLFNILIFIYHQFVPSQCLVSFFFESYYPANRLMVGM